MKLRSCLRYDQSFADCAYFMFCNVMLLVLLGYVCSAVACSAQMLLDLLVCSDVSADLLARGPNLCFADFQAQGLLLPWRGVLLGRGEGHLLCGLKFSSTN